MSELAQPTDPKTVATHGKRGPNFFLRALWYIFIGWWPTGISLTVGYLAGLTVIGLPLAFWIFNRTGTLLTLRPRSQTTTIVEAGGASAPNAYASSSPSATASPTSTRGTRPCADY